MASVACAGGSQSSSSIINSYPPELLLEILEAIPRCPTNVRIRTLSKMCRVNRAFLDVARPLLYSSLHLKIEYSLYEDTSQYHRLIRTLIENPQCAKHVRSLQISAAGAESADWLVIQMLLSLLDLKTLKVGGSMRKTTTESLVPAISRTQPRLEQLCLPSSTMTETEFGRLLPALPELKVFKGRIWVEEMSDRTEEEVAAALATPPTYKLRELCLGWGPRQNAFDYATQNSLTTLTHLTLTMNDWRATMDLSRLVSLTSLTITADSNGPGIFSPLPQCLPAFTKAIESIKDLPLRTLSISGSLAWPDYPLYNRVILESLPASLTKLVLGQIPSWRFDLRLFLHLLPTKPLLRCVVVDETVMIEMCPEDADLTHDEKCRMWFADKEGDDEDEEGDDEDDNDDEEDIVDELKRLHCRIVFRGEPEVGYNDYLGIELDPFGESSEADTDIDAGDGYESEGLEDDEANEQLEEVLEAW
ncbi:hypothetical protein JCM11491_006810 [Sporobolomyces phaffii]